jgi:hypothetical protein
MKTKNRPRRFGKKGFNRSLLLQSYLLRRGLVQRHGAAAAAARGHDAQVRTPRSPGHGGHEVPGHDEEKVDDDDGEELFSVCSSSSILRSGHAGKKKLDQSIRIFNLDLAAPRLLFRAFSRALMWPRVGAPAPPPVPAPPDPNLKRRIDTLALFAARNGPAFVDYTREQQRGNEEFEFLEGGEGASYFDFKLHEAVLEAARSGERHWDDDVDQQQRQGAAARGGGQEHHHHQFQPQKPAVDAFDLPAGLIP